jgi:hypothetical protein
LCVSVEPWCHSFLEIYLFQHERLGMVPANGKVNDAGGGGSGAENFSRARAGRRAPAMRLGRFDVIYPRRRTMVWIVPERGVDAARHPVFPEKRLHHLCLPVQNPAVV